MDIYVSCFYLFEIMEGFESDRGMRRSVQGRTNISNALGRKNPMIYQSSLLKNRHEGQWMVGHVYEPIKKHDHFYSIVYPLIFRLQFHNTSTPPGEAHPFEASYSRCFHCSNRYDMTYRQVFHALFSTNRNSALIQIVLDSRQSFHPSLILSSFLFTLLTHHHQF